MNSRSPLGVMPPSPRDCSMSSRPLRGSMWRVASEWTNWKMVSSYLSAYL